MAKPCVQNQAGGTDPDPPGLLTPKSMQALPVASSGESIWNFQEIQQKSVKSHN